MEAQQKALIEQVDRLQRRLDAAPGAVVSPAAATQAPPEPPKNAAHNDDHYQDGIVVWQTPDDAKVPFLLKFNVNTQIRYLNTTSADETFTDHLGVVRDVQCAQRHHRQPLDVHPGRLHFRSEAALQPHRVDVRGAGLDRRGGDHRLAVQQGLHA